jgi:hypothetical protein
VFDVVHSDQGSGRGDHDDGIHVTCNKSCVVVNIGIRNDVRALQACILASGAH